jgi:hypothetical protein
MSTSQQGPSADVRALSLPLHRTHLTLERANGFFVLQPGRRCGQAEEPSHIDWQPQPVASASLGPVHSSKVSKATGKKTPAQRRPNASQEVSSGDPPFLCGPDIAEPLPQTASIHPRRSKRLQPLKPSIAKGPTGITSTDSLNGRLNRCDRRDTLRSVSSRHVVGLPSIEKYKT